MTQNEIILRLAAKLERAESRLNQIQTIIDDQCLDSGDKERKIDNIITFVETLWFEEG